MQSVADVWVDTIVLVLMGRGTNRRGVGEGENEDELLDARLAGCVVVQRAVQRAAKILWERLASAGEPQVEGREPVLFIGGLCVAGV